MNKDGGYIVPEPMVKEISEQLLRRSVFPPLQAILESLPRRRLTLRDRLRLRFYDAQWWVHDRLFPTCHGEDY